jgi:peroxidase
MYTTIMPALSSSSSSICTFLLVFLLVVRASNCAAKATKSSRPPRQLSVDYYAKKCPQLEQLVGSVTSQQFKEAPVSGPATIRLFFHDCFVEVISIPHSLLSLPCMLYALAYYHATFFEA